MNDFFKSKKKPRVSDVQLFNGCVSDNCTDYVEWHFELPDELKIEVKEKFHIPKYRKVKNPMHKNEEILFLNFDSIYFEYCLSSCNDNWLNRDNYIGDDYRTAIKYNSQENIFLYWNYNYLADDGFTDLWEGYNDDVYTNIFDEGYEYDYDQIPNPNIEIIGEDKEKLLKIFYPIMDEILDGKQEAKDKLYCFNGD